MPVPEVVTEMSGFIECKTKRYFASRYGKLANGIFMYFYKDDRIKPRRVINILHTIIQSKEEMNINKNIINIILTK